jgi:bifunctional ADP-heptose synthase (sugar kinase/adenylyltransferase)
MAKILVIGELCVDRFVYCDIKRLCPEAPVPVLNPLYSTTNNGMAGNVVENLRTLLPDSEVLHWHQSNKIEKTRYVEKKSNQMITRVDDGELEPCDTILFLSPDQRKTITESDIVIISDYNKGYVSENLINQIGVLSKISILDTKKKLNENVIGNITFTKQNEVEYSYNKEIVDNHDEKFIVTLGSKGAMYMGEVFGSPKPQETIDVSGAGDTFVASFVSHFIKTNDIKSSILFANEVCSDVVNKKGVSLPDKKYTEYLRGL